MIDEQSLISALAEHGWTHDPDKKILTKENKVFTYEDLQHVSLYALGTLGEHYATWVSPSEFSLLAAWLLYVINQIEE